MKSLKKHFLFLVCIVIVCSLVDLKKVEAVDYYWYKYSVSTVQGNRPVSEGTHIGYQIYELYRSQSWEEWNEHVYYVHPGYNNLADVYTAAAKQGKYLTYGGQFIVIDTNTHRRWHNDMYLMDYAKTLVGTVIGSENAYPNNAVHTDKFYYVRGGVVNSAPNPPIFSNIANDQSFNYNQLNLCWHFLDPNPGDYQTGFQVVGSTTGWASWQYDSGEILNGNTCLSLPPLANANWHFAVRTRDSQGAWSTDWGYVYNAKLDTIAPVTGNAHPDNVNTRYTNQADGTTIRFHTINANDNLTGLHGVHFWSMREGIDADWTNTAWGVNGSAGLYYYDMPIRGEGNYLVRAHAMDRVGNGHGTNGWSNNVDMRVVVDRTNPTATGVSASGKWLNSTTFRVEVYGVNDNLSGIDRVMFPTWTIENGQDDLSPTWGVDPTYRGVHAGNGTWYLDIPISKHNNEEGAYTTHIYGYDKAGNQGYLGKVETHIDRTNPVHVSNSITGANYVNGNDYWVKPGQQIDLKVRAEDALSGLKTTEVSVYDFNYGGNEAANALFEWTTLTGKKLDQPSAHPYKWNHFVYNNLQKTVVNGEVQLSMTASPTTQIFKHDTQVQIQDNAGNYLTWLNLNKRIIIDGEKPTGSISQNISAITNNNVVLTATGNDGSGSGMKRIKLPNNSYVNGASATYTVSGNGTYTFEIEDNVGNITIKTITVSNIDKMAPTITFTPEMRDADFKDIEVQIVIADVGVSGFKHMRYAWSNEETKPTEGWSEWAAEHTPLLTQTGGGKWYLHIEAVDNAGNMAYAYRGIYEKIVISGGPSVNINVFPVPTGQWVNKPIDVYIMESGDAELLAKAKKYYEVTNSPLYPTNFGTVIPLDKKVQLKLQGENFIHVQYILDDGTKISSTTGPYLIDTGAVGDFEMKLVNASGVAINDWVNVPLKLVIGNPVASSISGTQKQYRIEGIHSDWQPYTDGTVINVEGSNRIFGRIVTKTGESSEQKMVLAKIDQTKPNVHTSILQINQNGTYDVTVNATDRVSSVQNVVLNDGTVLTQNGHVFTVKGVAAKPTSTTTKDLAGNAISSVFEKEPTIAFQSPYTLEEKNYREDVVVKLTDATKYILGKQEFQCPGNACDVTIQKNVTLTVINEKDGNETRKVIVINNLDKSALSFVLSGKRNPVNPTQLVFEWNYSLTSGSLVCTTNGVQTTIAVTGKTHTLTGKNALYECFVEGTYGTTLVKSNKVMIFADTTSATEGDVKIDQVPKKQNIHIDESATGRSFMINAKSDNYKSNEFPFPKGLFAP